MLVDFDLATRFRLLKRLGKKIVYSNNGCLDGVSQTSFASWGKRPVCADCAWRGNPAVCSDDGNLRWGAFRNEVADFQVIVGGNRADYNVDPRIREIPEFYCLDEHFWRPDLAIPSESAARPSRDHVQALPLRWHDADPDLAAGIPQHEIDPYLSTAVDEAEGEGHDVELISFHDVLTARCATISFKRTWWSTCSPLAFSGRTPRGDDARQTGRVLSAARMARERPARTRNTWRSCRLSTQLRTPCMMSLSISSRIQLSGKP